MFYMIEIPIIFFCQKTSVILVGAALGECAAASQLCLTQVSFIQILERSSCNGRPDLKIFQV